MVDKRTVKAIQLFASSRFLLERNNSNKDDSSLIIEIARREGQIIPLAE